MGGIGISVVPADLYQGVRIHPLCAQWSPSNANAAAVANPPGDCDDAGDHVSTAAVAAAVVSAYICAGVLSPQRALQYAHTAAPGSATATELSTSLTSATLCTEYARYRLAQQRNGIEISCRKIIPTGAHTWEVSFLDLLSRTAQQQIQQLDSQLSRKTSRFAPEEARKRLQDLYSSWSECTTLNVIQGHLLKRGVLPLFASLKYWFLYHVQIFGTFASAIKCVYRSIALYSLHDINNNCSAVVALVCAVEEVVKEVLNEADSSSGGAFSDGYAEQVDAVLKSYKADIVLKTANIV